MTSIIQPVKNAVLKTGRSRSLIPENKLIQISRNLSHRLKETKNELAKEIENAQTTDRRATIVPGATSAAPGGGPPADDLDEQTGPTEMFMEVETAEEKMRSTYWGLELFYKTGAIDPATQIYAVWLAVVSVAFCYNIWTITLREAFPQYGSGSAVAYWLIVDYLCDAIYLLDIVVKARMMYHNEEGLMVYDRQSMWRKYYKSQEFKMDVLALAPLDILYAIPQVGVRPALRVFRLIKVRSFWECFDRVGSLLDSPDIMKVLKMLVYILLMVHLYTCGYYAFSVHAIGVGVGQFGYEGESLWPQAYCRCYYIAFKIATSINSDKTLTTTQERAFMTLAWLICTFIVVVLLAQIREIFFGFTRDEDEFSRLVYTAMSYLKRYNCPPELEGKVRSWFMYMRATQKVLEMQKVLAFLPRHIQTALALEINYKTLSKVTLFANCDRTVLTDLVVKLKPVLYLPGDYICKKGEIGKEMYIIVKGQAEVVGPEGKVFVTMSAGAVFGEISLLAVGGANRRTANVRSKGFSNLFTLSKEDFEEIMQQYPLIYARLKRRVAETLARSNAAPPPPAAAEPGAAAAGGDASKNEAEASKAEEVPKTPVARPKTPKLLQLLRAALPNMPTLRRIFRVHPVEPPPEQAADVLFISDSVDAEIANLEWSTPSPETFYVRTEVEQQFWDAPESVTESAMDSVSGVSDDSRSVTDASDDSSPGSASTAGETISGAHTTKRVKAKTGGNDKNKGDDDKEVVKRKHQAAATASSSGGGGLAKKGEGATALSSKQTTGRIGIVRQQTGRAPPKDSSSKPESPSKQDDDDTKST